MYIEFGQLPDDARVWIYQADQPIGVDSKSVIDSSLKAFTNNWAAHGHALQASFTILDDHFIVLAVNERYNDASGCSIDSSVHIIKYLTEETGIDFFNRRLVALQLQDGISLIPTTELRQKFEEGIWNGQTPTFNTLATSVADVRNNWLIPAGATWLKKYVKGTAVV